MLSSTYSTTIIPDARARCFLYFVSAACALAGVVAITLWPWSPGVRAAGSLLWLAYWSTSFTYHLRAVAGIRTYVVSEDGAVRVISAGGRSKMAYLRAGTTVGGGSAWLRFECPGHRPWSELVIGPAGADKQLKNKDWRRLQVICRHLPAC